jgi:hypothetical protein
LAVFLCVFKNGGGFSRICIQHLATLTVFVGQLHRPAGAEAAVQGKEFFRAVAVALEAVTQPSLDFCLPIPKNTRAPMKSRHLAYLVFREIGVNLGQNLVGFSGSEVAFHLLIPLVFVPRMEAGRDFRPFLQAKMFDSLFDLLNAHGRNLILPGQSRKGQFVTQRGVLWRAAADSLKPNLTPQNLG